MQKMFTDIMYKHKLHAMAMFNNAYQSYKIMYNKEHEHTQPNVNWW